MLVLLDMLKLAGIVILVMVSMKLLQQVKLVKMEMKVLK